MIGPLAKFVTASNLFKIVLRDFGKVWRKSNVCIIGFDWLIDLYIFTLLHCYAIFLIVKNSCVGEEVSDINKSLCKKKCWWVRACAPHLWFVHIPNLHFFLHLPPLQRPDMCAEENPRRLRFGNIYSSDKFIGNHKIVTGKGKTQINVNI